MNSVCADACACVEGGAVHAWINLAPPSGPQLGVIALVNLV